MKLKKMQLIPYKKYIEKKHYYGWTNRETWLFLSWLECNEGLYRTIGNIQNSEMEDDSKSFHIANVLLTFKEKIKKEVPPNGGACDLVNQALERVNYTEILNHYL